VQFTAGEEYVKLVEEARALLSHSAPRATLDEIQLRAMRTLVAELKRKKYAVAARPKEPACAAATRVEPMNAGGSTAELQAASTLEAGAQAQPNAQAQAHPEAHPQPKARAKREPESAQTSESESQHPRRRRRRGRHVPAFVRRAVFNRDEGRCTYADPSGRRCGETHGLELHHVIAFAQGGEHTEANLTLRCRSHNALAAEQDFGRDFIEFVRDAGDHGSWAEHEDG
jgi:5-methylcytosine-specific restriction endonuclease McrA